jgi:uncharacterized damage-inducible protein DinB
MSKPDQYRRWFQYERDAHQKVIESLRRARRGTEEYAGAVTFLAHIAAARRLWLYRLGKTSKSPTEFFPRLSLDEAVRELEAIEREWASYIEKLDDAEVARVFKYRSTEGDWYRNSVEDILAHMFGHSSYHRGQIAMLVRQTGAQPAETDFLFWTRELIDAPSS